MGHTVSEIEMEQKEKSVAKGDVILEVTIEYALHMGNGYPSDLIRLNHSIARSVGSKLALENLITVHSQSIFESLKSLLHAQLLYGIGKGS